MFKQPAENTNATPIDEHRTAERAAHDVDAAAEHEAVQAEARRLASERGEGDKYTHEDWTHAEAIVRNRKIALSKA